MFQETRELIVTAPTKVGKYHELAEAIRRGCKTTKRMSGAYLSEDETRACALGAAAIGTGFKWRTGNNLGDHLEREFPVLGEILVGRIATMNDGGMPRERIADWLCREGGCEHAL